MIIFKGSKILNNNTVFLIFENDKGGRDEIPLSVEIGNYFLARFRNLDPPETKPVEPQDP